MTLGLWVPLTPLMLLAAPVVMLGAPLAHLSPAAHRRRPIRLALATGRLLMSLSGLVIDVDAPGVRVRIRIF